MLKYFFVKEMCFFMLVLRGRRERIELLSCWVLLCKVIGAVSLVPLLLCNSPTLLPPHFERGRMGERKRNACSCFPSMEKEKSSGVMVKASWLSIREKMRGELEESWEHDSSWD